MLMLIPQLIICFWISGELFKISKVLKEKEVELPEATAEAEDADEEKSDSE